jgi:SAM-dependent methyltransferase
MSELARYVTSISAASKLQARSLDRWLSAAGPRFHEFAESVCASITQRLFDGDHERGVRAYLALCQELNQEQFHFKKQGVYRTADARSAYADVYSDTARMTDYIVGLLLSYLFWPSHYKMIAFFQDHLARRPPASLCEIGVGHGLLTREVLRAAPGARVTLVDISPASLAVARRLLAAFGIDASGVDFVLGDFLVDDTRFQPAELLVLGEVLEHVDDPGRFLARARTLLAPDGRVFMTTCANCPAPDHVYLFKDADEIRALVRASGLAIEAELVLPLEEKVPEAEWAAKRVNVNYAAILRVA